MPLRRVVGVGKVHGDAWRRIRGEELRLRHGAIGKVEVKLNRAARQGVVADVLQRVAGRHGRAGPGRSGQQKAEQDVASGMAHCTAPDGLDFVGHWHQPLYSYCSPSAMLAGRSIQPPLPFEISSTSSIWSSLMAV